MHNYASLQETQDHEEQGILFHVSEPTRPRWNHIEDLDAFFTRIYRYHQGHGFACMVLKKILSLHQFYFIVCFTVYLFHGIDYQILFTRSDNRTISDALLPVSETVDSFGFYTWCILTFVSILFLLKIMKFFHAVFLYWDIKQFYNSALGIPDNNLDNLTWYEIQNKVKQVQLEQQMCIHKKELTQLDIYHRILRQENYLVAMVNKRLIPPRTNLPCLGEIVYWTHALRQNIQLLLFWSPWSPFENPWHLREEYKRQSLRHELATKLGRQILWLAFFNFILSPLIFVWQLLFHFFSYFEQVRREPGKFGVRYWSGYACLFLRHFNELDHELHNRLTRAYRPAAKYLSAFTSPMIVEIAGHFIFLCSAILGVVFMISLWDNVVLQIEHVVTIFATLSGVIAVCRSMVPEEYYLWAPEALLQVVVLHIHYFPSDWQNLAHTTDVRAKFQQLFQYRFAAILEEFLSPLLTPYFLVRYVYPRSLDIVDFFRNFTVSVVGVGDVCSFAQMDVRKHGNPEWQSTGSQGSEAMAPDQYSQAEDGKVELSLMHFTTTNPDWVPPEDNRDFISTVQDDASDAYPDLYQMNLFDSSLDLEDTDSLMPRNSLPRGSIFLNKNRDSYKSSPMSDVNLLPNLPSALLPKSRVQWKAEGREVNTNAIDMRASTLVLHNRHAQQRSGTRSHRAEQSGSQQQPASFGGTTNVIESLGTSQSMPPTGTRSSEETTPLLNR